MLKETSLGEAAGVRRAVAGSEEEEEEAIIGAATSHISWSSYSSPELCLGLPFMYRSSVRNALLCGGEETIVEGEAISHAM